MQSSPPPQPQAEPESQPQPVQPLPISTLLQTAKTYISVFTTLDPTILTPILSPHYIHHFAPSSLNIQPRNLSTFTSHIAGMSKILKSFPVRAKEIWPNPSLNQVTVWADSEIEFREEVKDVRDGDTEEWRYQGEYIFVLTLDREGKVERVLEFLDSDGSKRLLGLVARARGRVGLGGGDGMTGEVRG